MLTPLKHAKTCAWPAHKHAQKSPPSPVICCICSKVSMQHPLGTETNFSVFSRSCVSVSVCGTFFKNQVSSCSDPLCSAVLLKMGQREFLKNFAIYIDLGYLTLKWVPLRSINPELREFLYIVILTVNNGTFFNKVMNEYISKTYIAYRTHVYIAANLKWCEFST